MKSKQYLSDLIVRLESHRLWEQAGAGGQWGACTEAREATPGRRELGTWGQTPSEVYSAASLAWSSVGVPELAPRFQPWPWHLLADKRKREQVT